MKNTTTRKAVLLLALGALCCPLSMAQEDSAAALPGIETAADKYGIGLQVNIHPSEGFMDGGWGIFNFNFTNPEDNDITVKTITAEWKIKGEKLHQWSQDANLNMKGKEKGHHGVTTPMLGNAKKLTKEKGGIPYVEGVVILSNGKEIPYSIEVPAAELPSEIQAHKGKYVSVDLQKNTWDALGSPEKILYYLDKAYYHMQKLTSNTPFGGKTSVFLEAPRNPYFAYAGNPVVLNTEYVLNSAKEFDRDELCFGWIHEMGHNFDDKIGGWYNEGTYTEFQANIKLSYVADVMCTEKSKYRIISWKDHKTPLTGVEFNDEYFLGFVEPYLKSEKTWQDMSSDDYHALYMVVIRKKGWDVMKKFYKTYGKLAQSGQTPPQGWDKVKLQYAILSYCAGTDLSPLYAKWRIPVDKAEIKALLKQYKVK